MYFMYYFEIKIGQKHNKVKLIYLKKNCFNLYKKCFTINNKREN